GPFDWSINRPKFFDAFHACIVAIASTGNNIILDHVLESQQWHDDILKSLSNHDVFFVGVHCPIEILREREKNRDDQDVGNRYLGEAEYHLRNVHSYGVYDYEIDSSLQSPKESASLVISAWQDRSFITNR
ncbi:MAG: chloramphenicol phosphotransferase, partial [Chloroflexota bacterium]